MTASTEGERSEQGASMASTEGDRAEEQRTGRRTDERRSAKDRAWAMTKLASDARGLFRLQSEISI